MGSPIKTFLCTYLMFCCYHTAFDDHYNTAFGSQNENNVNLLYGCLTFRNFNHSEHSLKLSERGEGRC